MTAASAPATTNMSKTDIEKIKDYLVQKASPEIDLQNLNKEGYENVVAGKLKSIFQQLNLHMPDKIRDEIFDVAIEEIFGFGPIQTLLDDPLITEVMVNGPKKVYYESKGQLIKSSVKFLDDDQVLKLINRIITPLGRQITTSSPTVDARLPDGSRVNAVIPPVSIDGPSITIRKFSKDRLQINDLISFGSLTENMAEFLRACVIARLNIIISGGTGSGKTTLLNVLSGFIPENERIVTIEDAAELQLQQDHVVRMETKQPSLKDLSEVTIRDLVRNALRMRPDRIVVGECRGGEALDMLQAMNTGHDGSLTTVHANSPRDSISRLETLVMMSGLDLPVKFIRQQIASAVDVIVQITRLKDGSRRVTAITEISGMEGDVVVMTDIFKFEQTGITEDGLVIGDIRTSGLRPIFTPRLEAAGFKLKPEIYGASISQILGSSHKK